ncbi:putative TetR-family transcriptional regulator [Actinoplanes missouriensis 431]|uniref:Putative TetR-family transcriptional regulator n=1 Tax=Actinoplanes missouriensis (strain ATCC 14538 / DSM 43046 / CBS 188.64 / JCM 3121 / NBRC 102363 / NCIMB 12654 / NRRL B-3342 / UNCC 431) TaxID=512565 RepID=I0H993_ACTM4|nr:putative TetR-family transcriptional regulator [Actinoplanes missouriensis 431]
MVTSPLRADAARNRDLLLATARAVLAAEGPTLQLNDIARRAGVGVGTAYRHFPTRRALVEALADDAFTALLGEAREANRHDDAWTGVAMLLRALLLRQLADPALTEILSTGPDQDATERTTGHRDEFTTLARGVLERARAADLLRPGLADDDLQHLVCGVVFALRIGDSLEERVDRYLQVLLRGIRAG